MNKLLNLISPIEGDIIEIGTYNGDTSEIICNYIQKNNLNKKYFGIDTFNGYCEEDLEGANKASLGNHSSKRWASSKKQLEKRLSPYGNIFKIFEGDSKSVIPKLIKDKAFTKFSLIYIDCNLYPPSLKAMNDLYPLLNKGGIISIDEHLVGGETKAIKEFSSNHSLDLKHFRDPYPGPSYFILKPD